MTTRHHGFLPLGFVALFALVQCGSDDSDPATAAGSGGVSGGAAAGGSGAGRGGTGASGGSGTSGTGGAGGTGGSGTGGSGTGGSGTGGSGTGGAGTGGSGTNGTAGASGVGGTSSDAGATTLGEIVSVALWEQMFPHRADTACSGGLFTYAAFIEAAGGFPTFAAEGSLEVRRREVAAFLGNISHETTGGWPTAPGGPQSWGLCFREEVGCGSGACTQYCDSSNTRYPCAASKTYHGRGPMQLSWNYNYGQAGEALGLNLLANPERVAEDGVVSFRTALWFWMTPQPPKPSAHAVMVGNWQPSPADTAAGRVPGFGMTINIINGGLECNRPTDARVEDRVAFFTRYAGLLGTTTGANLYCNGMQSF